MIVLVNYVFIAILVFSTCIYGNNINKGTISGEVIDRDTKQKIIGALIEVMNTKFLTVTDADGNFIIRDLEPKTYNLKI